MSSKIRSSEPPCSQRPTCFCPRIFRLARCPFPSESIANDDDNTVENAIESLFNAASTNSSIELLPWLEREFTLRAMRKTNNNQVRAAKLLGITRATLRKRLERNGALKVPEEE